MEGRRINHSKALKIGTLLVLMLVSFSELLAQWNTGGEIENHIVNFGFILGVNSNSFTVIKKSDFPNYTIQSAGSPGTVKSGKLNSITANFSSGFHLGLLANFKISDNVDFRFTPDVNFSDRTLTFGYDSLSQTAGTSLTNPIVKTIQSTFLDFPLLLKFKSDRKGNLRAYLIGGIQYSYDIIPKKKTEDAAFEAAQKLIHIQSNSLSYKIGVGIDLYYEYFKMSPEISITNGFFNVLKQDNNPFSSPIQKLIPTSIQLSVYFE
jgi:Fe-S cluster assembly iron-binding protein IscA